MFFDIVRDDPPSRLMALRWTGRHNKACPPKLAIASEGGTPDNQFIGDLRFVIYDSRLVISKS